MKSLGSSKVGELILPKCSIMMLVTKI